MPPPQGLHPHVNILFYADSSATNLLVVYPGGILRRQPEEFGLRMLKDILEANPFPTISVDLVNRFWNLNGDGSVDATRKTSATTLTTTLLQKYDEIWFFGKHLGNFNDPWGFGWDQNGYSDSELTPSELDALAKWMNNGGGVLMLGDHSNWVSTGGMGETNLYNLGRALGKNVLRAGQMRVWEGDPGAYKLDKQVNTSGDADDMVDMPNQEDAVPQDIYPAFRDYFLKGEKFAERFWHPLFVGAPRSDDPNGIIKVFPDHGHEGALNFPTTYAPAIWPDAGSFQPKPEVVARGTNQDNGEQIDLVSAYDGQLAGVGRIVAHTTFHHFVNVNLHGFLNSDGTPDETLQIISQYFANLAWWLMPRHNKNQGLGWVLQSLTKSTIMRDLQGAPLGVLGTAAYRVLGEMATGGQIRDLINVALEKVIPPTRYNGSLRLLLPSQAYLLGGLVAEQQLAYASIGHHREASEVHELAARGIKRALREEVEELEARADTIKAVMKDYD